MPGTPRVDELAYGLMARSAPDSAVLNRANSGDYNMDLQSPPESEASEGRESFIYPWVSPTMTIPGNGVVGVGAEPAPTMSLKGGKLIVRIFPDGGARTDGTDPSTGRVAVENSGTGDSARGYRSTLRTPPFLCPFWLDQPMVTCARIFRRGRQRPLARAARKNLGLGTVMERFDPKRLR